MLGIVSYAFPVFSKLRSDSVVFKREKPAIRLHSLCMLQGGAEDFFFSGSFFYIPPQGPYKFSEPPKQSAEKLIPPPPSPLPPPKKYQNKYLYNSKLYMFEISRDMFNKNIERALTVYVIPMPASLSSAN